MSRIVRLANERLVKIPVSGIASLAAPTTAELSAVGVKRLDVDMTKQYDVGMDDSDNVSEMGVNDVSKIEVPTIRSYHGNLEFFRQLDPTSFAPTTSDCTALISENEQFYFGRRYGKAGSAAFATGDVMELYLFQADVWKFPTADGLLKAQIKLWQLGSYKLNAVVA